MGHKKPYRLSRAEKERLKKRHFHISLGMFILFAILGTVTTGVLEVLFYKGSELTAAAMIYWHFFGSLEG